MEQMVSQIDLFPTIMEVIGAEPLDGLEGSSLLPVVREPQSSEPVHDFIFTEQTYHGSLEPIRAVRSERYKYVQRKVTPAPRMRQAGPTTPLLEDVGWYERSNATEEFYDLYLDPQEACNRIDDPRLSDELSAHRAALTTWMTATNDPFISGGFPAPPGS